MFSFSLSLLFTLLAGHDTKLVSCANLIILLITSGFGMPSCPPRPET